MSGRNVTASALVLVVLATPLLAGCVATTGGTGAGGAAAPASAAPAQAAGPGACAGPIADYQRLIDSDQKTGHLSASVHRRVVADLEGVKAACAAGRAGEANSRLSTIKNRYGYRRSASGCVCAGASGDRPILPAATCEADTRTISRIDRRAPLGYSGKCLVDQSQ